MLSKNKIIIFLGAIWLITLALLITVLSTDKGADPVAVDIRRDSVLIHKAEILALQAKERAMVEDRRADSVRHAQEKKAFKSTIKRLE
jgi:hypothetical protein